MTIAVLDTGIWRRSYTQETTDDQKRLLAEYDATLDREDPGFYQEKAFYDYHVDDFSGHGTHVTSVMISSGQAESGQYQG